MKSMNLSCRLCKNNPRLLFCLVVGTLLFLYTIFILFYIGYSVGALAILGLAFVFLSFAFCFHWFGQVKWLRILYRLFLALLILLIVFALFLMLYGSSDTADGTEDFVMILGAQIHGEEVEPHLATRLDAAIRYLSDHPSVLVIVSGGQGEGESIPEAVAMKCYLIEHGIAGERIVTETLSTSTYENFKYSQECFEKYQEEKPRVLIVTSNYHIFRASQIADRLGISHTTLHADTVWYELPFRIARECIAIVKLIFLGR